MNAGEETTSGPRCASCGASFDANARFCRGCGAALRDTNDEGARTVEATALAQPTTGLHAYDSASPNDDAAAPAESAQPVTARDAASPRAEYPGPPTGPETPAQGAPSAVPTGHQPSPGFPAAPAPGYQPPLQAGHPGGYPATPPGYGVPPPGYPGYAGQPPVYQPPAPGGYPTSAGYPLQQTQGPLPQQQGTKQRGPSGWLVGGIAAAILAIVGIGVGIVLAARGSSTPTRLLAVPVVTGAAPAASAAASSSAPVSVGAHHAAAPSTPVAKVPPAIGPVPRVSIARQVDQQREVENTIQREFSLITEHKFSAAYALLAPSLQSGESGWVASHRSNGIYNVNVATSATINSPESATASIVKMTTLDGEGCKNWTGSWNLAKIAGQWRISEANIHPEPC